ncbi:MAG: helix-turn-helix transcriptional regulator [Anaerolineales bacterium]
MTINPILKIIRAKKLGVLIRDARVKSGKSLEECAQAIGISIEDLSAMEFGERPPTLPELEILAYFLEIPLENFWGSQVLILDESDKMVEPDAIKQLRQSVIGDLIHKGRIQTDLSIDDLAQKSGIAPVSLQSYEKGDLPIPLPELETLAQVLNNSIADFEDQQGPVGSWFTEQRNMREFLDLPQELKEFVSKPINRPYIELAVRLSELKVEKLRALAEGLLEITL